MFEHTVSFFVPRVSSAHMRALESMKNTRLMVFVQDYNTSTEQNTYVIGCSKEYALEDDFKNEQMYATLTSIEGVTITAQSGELPRAFTGTFTPDSSDGSVTIS